MFRFEEESASRTDSANGATSTGAGETDASVDSSMMSALEQMMVAFGYGPDASANQSASPPNQPCGASNTVA